MGKITNEMAHTSYEVGKNIYHNKISRLNGLKILTDLGMNNSSANYYIYNYAYFITGKLFTGTISAYATEYYLQKILEDKGNEGLETALLALSQHLDYYEEKTKRSVKKRRNVYDKYYELLENNIIEPIYADEVDSNGTYSEGKTKQVLINSYERNPIARKKCIEHFGLNCQVCDFNFENKFGVLGKDFIHVHHKIDIATVGKEYSVNPITDLIPVCPNCHSMLHKKKPNAYTISELKQIISEKY
ncbi:HNH endonuclease [Mesonia sp. MT50]|uniref:HNH endonuclease n=1 Tax=Mesonia profundi TaxID=3070998 RepID=A0ABU1A4D3_9FLAO|nr:HNH endonuclease [Mesonia profundi]MDQ7918559.1 HNH endonuclease [Mesonia profundi]